MKMFLDILAMVVMLIGCLLLLMGAGFTVTFVMMANDIMLYTACGVISALTALMYWAKLRIEGMK